jgi:hypothetical protein
MVADWADLLWPGPAPGCLGWYGCTGPTAGCIGWLGFAGPGAWLDFACWALPGPAPARLPDWADLVLPGPAPGGSRWHGFAGPSV